MTTHIYRRDKTKKIPLEVIFQKSCFDPKIDQKGRKRAEKHLFVKYVIDVQYRHPATPIDRRDETKKMPLEVIFRKSSFRPKNRP